MKKEFLTYNLVRNNALKLAKTILTSGFMPDVIYTSLRGGAYIANVISEYFKIVRTHQRPVLYAAVVARSYEDVGKATRVVVDGWTYDPEYLRNGDKILLVDDIFDSGETLNHLANIIIEKGVPRQDICIAVHDYKIFSYKHESVSIHPDYFCRKHVIESPQDDIWIHYLSHELVGLTPKELDTYYFSEEPELRDVLTHDLFEN